MTTDPTRSIDSSGGVRPNSVEGGTHLVTNAHGSLTVPVGRLAPEQLRVLLRQRIGLDHVVGVAVSRVADDPLLEGDFYPGDVLAALLELGDDQWAGRPDERATLLRIVDRLSNADERDELDDDLVAGIDAFRRRWA